MPAVLQCFPREIGTAYRQNGNSVGPEFCVCGQIVRVLQTFSLSQKTERELALSPFRNRNPKDTTYYSLQNKNNAEPETNQVQHQTNQGLKKISQSFRCGT